MSDIEMVIKVVVASIIVSLALSYIYNGEIR